MPSSSTFDGRYKISPVAFRAACSSLRTTSQSPITSPIMRIHALAPTLTILPVVHKMAVTSPSTSWPHASHYTTKHQQYGV
eukprot:2357963-Ditylum_brightwellii.AAC.1